MDNSLNSTTVKIKSAILPDPGYFEGDIKASIEDAAQSHIKWIYDCLLVRMESNGVMRLSQADRCTLKKSALDCYKKYVSSYLSEI